MQISGHWWVKTGRKLLFIQKCPQFSQKFSASNACMLVTFSMSEYITCYLPNFDQTVKLGFSDQQKQQPQSQQQQQLSCVVTQLNLI